MTATSLAPVVEREPAGAPAAADDGARWHRFAPVAMLAVVAVGAVLPMLRNRIFYFWDDSAAVAVPWYRRIAEEVLAGNLPVLQLDMWRGGNLAAEAATGLWNPIVLGAAIATYPIDNLALAITVMKALFMVIMAGGVYLLCREYGAKVWPAAAVGAALPLTGYTLFMDATSWVNGLLISAFLPYVWWTARRALHGRGSLGWVVVAGYLCCSVGNPYGMLGTAVVLLAVLVEGWLTRHRKRILGLMLAGVAIVLSTLIVYLPFVLSSEVTYRAESRTNNDGFLAPSLTDLAGASSPSFQPWMPTWGLPNWTVPVMYIAWFLLPTLPWLQLRVVRERWRELSGLLLFGGIFLLLTLGPSQVGMFRWPLPAASLLTLAVGVLWAVLASSPLESTRRRARIVASVAIVGFGFWTAWAAVPDTWRRHAFSAVLVLGLLALLIRFGPATKAGFVVLTAGTLAVLSLQLYWFPGNNNVANYAFPTSQQQLEDRFANRYQGITVQVADIGKVPPGDLVPAKTYQDMLFGSMYSVAGVEALTDYSGIGFNRLDGTLCFAYQGSTCKDAWDRLWERPADSDVPLADLLRAQTVVVQHRLEDSLDRPPPDGWRLAEQNAQVAVWKRVDPPPWPDGRLSHATKGVEVLSDRRIGPTGEQVTFRRTGDALLSRLTFARLAWPGYTATLNGLPIPVRTGPAGLLQVDLPTGTVDGDLVLAFEPPGFRIGLIGLGVGVVMTICLVAVPRLRRRRAGVIA